MKKIIASLFIGFSIITYASLTAYAATGAAPTSNASGDIASTPAAAPIPQPIPQSPASAPTQQSPTAPAKSELDTTSKKAIDTLFKIEKATGKDGKELTDKDGNKLLELNNLQKVSTQVGSQTEGSYSDVFAAIVKTISGAAVIMTFVGIVVSGIMFVFAQGEEGRITKARTILIYIVVGDLIIAASYMIIRGITLIKPT